MPQLKTRISDELHQRLVRFCELSTGQISATTTMSLALSLFLDAYPDGVTEDLMAEVESRPKRGRKPGQGHTRRPKAPPAATTAAPAPSLPPSPPDDAGHRPPAATSSSSWAPAPAPAAALPGTTAETPAPFIPEPRRKGRPPKVCMTPEQQARMDALMARHYAEQDAIDEEDARSLREERMNAEKLLEQQRAQVIAERMRQLGKA